MSFTLDATDAATFTIYRLVQEKNGTYSLKTLQTTALAWDKQAGKARQTGQAECQAGERGAHPHEEPPCAAPGGRPRRGKIAHPAGTASPKQPDPAAGYQATGTLAFCPDLPVKSR